MFLGCCWVFIVLFLLLFFALFLVYMKKAAHIHLYLTLLLEASVNFLLQLFFSCYMTSVHLGFRTEPAQSLALRSTLNKRLLHKQTSVFSSAPPPYSSTPGIGDLTELQNLAGFARTNIREDFNGRRRKMRALTCMWHRTEHTSRDEASE